ncbi:MAG: YegS/Rv2252/BmrU family lipid kinase [Chlorobiaceae bacterium]|nr:YegS/Rv2252/BmrU family lipid kinase [Chlorobiaceae bacterium]
MARQDSFTFIFNPAADKGRAAGKAGMLEQSLEAFPNASIKVSRFAGHAGELARSAASGSSTLIACGGDGTLNEIVNAVVGMPVRVGIYPVGSANDFLKSLHPVKRATEEVLGGIAASSSRMVDLGNVRFDDGRSRYFVNSIGIGFTGRIARTVQATTWFRGELSYAYALVSVLLGYAPVNMHIDIETPDGKIELREPVFSFSVSNGAVEGGKFRIAPHADLSDGLLDVCILKAIPKWRFPGYVLKYLKGTQIDEPDVLYCKASSLRVFMPEGDAMHMDGEVFRHVSGEMGISAVPHAVEMLCDP